MEIVYFCENAHLLRHRFEQIYASAIYYQMDSITKAMYCKAKHSINMRHDPVILDAGDLILLSTFPKSQILICAPENRQFPLETLPTNCEQDKIL